MHSNFPQPPNLSTLSHNTLSVVCSFLSIDNIRNAMLSCRNFFEYVHTSEFWSTYNRNTHQKLDLSIFQNLSTYEITQLYLVQEFLQRTNQQQIKLKSVQATSTDMDQILSDCLSGDPDKFWSSTGTEFPDQRDEIVVFNISKGFAFISKLRVQFLKADYINDQFFPSKKIIIELGMSSDSLYYKQEFNVVVENQMSNQEEIIFDIELNQIVCSQLIKITLQGKVTMVESEGLLYYVAIQSIKAFGVLVQDKLPQNLACQKASFLLRKSSSVKSLRFDEKKQQQFELFNASKSLEMFDILPELRINEYIFETFKSNPIIFQQYLNNLKSKSIVLNELETIVFVSYKLNQEKLINNLNEIIQRQFIQSYQLGPFSNDLKKNINKVLLSHIEYSFVNQNLPFERELGAFVYITHSYALIKWITNQLAKYFKIEKEQLSVVNETIKKQLSQNSPSFPFGYAKASFLNYFKGRLMNTVLFYLLDYWTEGPIVENGILIEQIKLK